MSSSRFFCSVMAFVPGCLFCARASLRHNLLYKNLEVLLRFVEIRWKVSHLLFQCQNFQNCENWSLIVPLWDALFSCLLFWHRLFNRPAIMENSITRNIFSLLIQIYRQSFCNNVWQGNLYTAEGYSTACADVNKL